MISDYRLTQLQLLRSLQIGLYRPVQYGIGGQTNSIPEALFFSIPVQLGPGKTRISPQLLA